MSAVSRTDAASLLSSDFSPGPEAPTEPGKARRKGGCGGARSARAEEAHDGAPHGVLCLAASTAGARASRRQSLIAQSADPATCDVPHPTPQDVKKTVKIGRPGFRVTKQFDQETRQRSLLFQASGSRIPLTLASFAL